MVICKIKLGTFNSKLSKNAHFKANGHLKKFANLKVKISKLEIF